MFARWHSSLHFFVPIPALAPYNQTRRSLLLFLRHFRDYLQSRQGLNTGLQQPGNRSWFAGAAAEQSVDKAAKEFVLPACCFRPALLFPLLSRPKIFSSRL